MRLPKRELLALSLCVIAGIASSAVAQSYRVERVASGLNQPTYVTQAPDDPANILYYTTRTENANPGFGAINNMGAVWRYDLDTRTSSMVLDLSSRTVTNDTGLQTIAFHPDFNNPATAGFGKLFVSSSEASSTALNRVEEYDVDLSGANPSYAASFNRTILQYQNNAQNNHTIDWIGFDPTAAGAARDYLYISTGDGSFGNGYNGGTSPTGRPSQNPNDVAGKMLRVDVVGSDAYPGDPLKNFAIPVSNPIPTYNTNNPGSPISGLGEIFLTGLRNVYRASFDRANGDLWMGDVGEVFAEEISFLKAGSNTSGPPVDYGWPQREATFASDVNGAPHTSVNPFTGAPSLEPLQQFLHDGGGEAVIGGYLYRGPVAELQGKYIYTDFVGTTSAAQIWMLDFDRDTTPATYNGNNGTNTDISTLWQSLVFDPTDPSYLPDSTRGSSAGLDHIVSFGEDNAGNIYLVDFGNGVGFDGQYPGAGLGEIFRIVPNLEVTITVDRDTGGMTFSNSTGENTDIRAYTLLSPAGAIDPDSLTPITGRLDAMPNGNGTVDPNNFWQITSDPGDQERFEEESTGGAATFAGDQQFALSPSGGWIQSIYEDLQLSVVLGDGTVIPAVVDFLGNDGQPFDRSDLNFNGSLDPNDWDIFRANHDETFAGMSIADSYSLGDLDSDGDNDFDDFRLFQTDYVAAHGMQAFATLLHVPEPGSMMLMLSAALGWPLLRRRRQCVSNNKRVLVGRRHGRCMLQLPIAAAALLLSCLGWSEAEAVMTHQYTFNDGTASDTFGADGQLMGNSSITLGVLDLPGGNGGGNPNNGDYLDLPASTIDINNYTDATFEAWFTWEGGGAWQRVFDFGRMTGGSQQGRDYIFFTPSSGGGVAIAAMTDNAGGPDEDVINAGFPVSTNIKHHVALVVDDDSNGGSDSMSLYLDGQFINDVAMRYSMSDLSSNLAWIGRSLYNGDAFLNGKIDEFRIYDNALSAQDVSDSYDAGPEPLLSLRLNVNTVTGEVSIENVFSQTLAFDYYRVGSEAGALNDGTWNSLDAQNVDAVGAEAGESWDPLGAIDKERVAEAFLLGASSLEPGATRPLGKLYDPAVFGAMTEADLTFDFALQNSDLVAGKINYIVPALLPGDFNGNGPVENADLTLLLNNWAQPSSPVPAGWVGIPQPTAPSIDNDELTALLNGWGQSVGSGSQSSTAIPEPASLALVLAACVACGTVLNLQRQPH